MHKFIIEQSYFYGTLGFFLVASFVTETWMRINTFPSCGCGMENRAKVQRTVILRKPKFQKFRRGRG